MRSYVKCCRAWFNATIAQAIPKRRASRIIATIRDVAKKAGVSIATVSRVINATKFVSDDARERVLAAIQELNYQPNALGQGLRRQQTRVIGVLVPSVADPFFGELAFAIEKALFGKGFRAQICSTENDPDKERAYVDLLLRAQVDAVIFTPALDSSENVYRLLGSGIHVVAIDRPLSKASVTEILVANEEGGYVAVQHLAQLGHVRIAVISSRPELSPGKERLQGACQALDDFGILKPEYVVDGNLGYFELGFSAANALLERSHPPTAIFAMTDVIAVGVMNAAYRMNVDVPKQLSVVGFDDLPLAKYSRPGLTTIAQPIDELGTTAVHHLFDQLSGKKSPVRRVILHTELVIRESTAPPLPVR